MGTFPLETFRLVHVETSTNVGAKDRNVFGSLPIRLQASPKLLDELEHLEGKMDAGLRVRRQR